MFQRTFALAVLLGSLLVLGSPAVAQNPRVFEQSDSTQTLTLTGEKFTVTGSNNTLIILGSCSPLVVAGSNNTIRVQATDQIAIAGNDNTITWSAAIERDLPQIEDEGKNNTVQSGEVSPDDQ